MEKIEQYKNSDIPDTVSDISDTVSDISSDINETLHKSSTITIKDIAISVGKAKEEIKLPNGKIVESYKWKPEELIDIYKSVNEYRKTNGLGVNDLIIIDGGVPTWLLPVISHALHPVSTAVNYPQGNTFIPLNGIGISESGEGENLEFNVENKGDYTLVEFNLSQSAIDLQKTMQTLEAPKVELGKPVIITGRGPVAIATGLAEAYSHIVPFVANFQPGTGAVVSISHDSKNPLGTIIEI